MGLCGHLCYIQIQLEVHGLLGGIHLHDNKVESRCLSTLTLVRQRSR